MWIKECVLGVSLYMEMPKRFLGLGNLTFFLRPDEAALELTPQKLVLENITIQLILYWSLSYSLTRESQWWIWTDNTMSVKPMTYSWTRTPKSPSSKTLPQAAEPTHPCAQGL